MPAPPSTALLASNIWSGVGLVNTAPAQAASSMPGPTKPPWGGSWPEPPPETSATLPDTGASARTTTLDSGSTRIRPECACSMPRSMASTTLSGAWITFFICSLSLLRERGLYRFLRPLLGPRDGLFPPAVEPLALLLAHLRLVAAPETPPALEFLLVRPEPRR